MYRFSQDILVSLTKNIATINPMINNINPVILYLKDMIVVMNPLFVNAVPISNTKAIVVISMILYFLRGNCCQKSCSLVDWLYNTLPIITIAHTIQSSFRIRTIFQNILSQPNV